MLILICKLAIHDVRCKVDVAGQTGRTELVNPNLEQKVVWNQSFKLYVCEVEEKGVGCKSKKRGR